MMFNAPTSSILAGQAAFRLVAQDNASREISSVVRGITTDVLIAQSSVSDALKGLGREIRSVGQQLSRVSKATAVFGAAATTGIVAATIQAGKFETETNKFEAVFGDASKATSVFADRFARDLGRSRREVRSFLADAQDLFVPIGIRPDAARRLGQELVQLTANLAATNAKADADVFLDLTRALTGSSETVQKYGVSLSQASVAAELLKQGIDPSNATEAQRVQARFNFILSKSTAALGSAAKNAGMLTGAIAAQRAAFSDLVVQVGEPYKELMADVVSATSEATRSISDFLDENPMVNRAVGGTAVAITGVGVAGSVAANGISNFGGTLASVGGGLFLFGRALPAIGGGLLRLTARAVPAQLSVGKLFTGLSRLSGILGRGLIVRPLLGSLRLAGTGMAGLAARIGPLFTNPLTAVPAAVAIALGSWREYWVQNGKQAERFGKILEEQRQQLLPDSFRAAGQLQTPAIDFNSARVVPDSELAERRVALQATEDDERAASPAISRLGQEIQDIETPLERFRRRLDDAGFLLSRGQIDQDQFNRFREQEQNTLRQSDPLAQARQGLLQQIRSPLESFRESVREAGRVFGREPVLYRRAIESAMASFRANNQAFQVAQSLRTPGELLRDSVAEARKLFANDTENLSRAIADARERFRATDPIQSVVERFRTERENIAAEFRELQETLRDAPAELRRVIFERFKKEGRVRIANADPNTSTLERIRQANLSEPERVAGEISEAFQLVGKGLSLDDFRAFQRQAIHAFVDRPENPGPQLTSLATQSAAIASNIGSFAPSQRPDKQLLESQERQEELQEAMVEEMRKIRRKGLVIGP